MQSVYAYHTGRTIGRYKLLELVGSGGTAEVYRSVHPDLGREVAIKILYPSYTNDPGFVKRFRQEAQTVAALAHPHIVQVYDFASTEDGLYYIVMQYVNGVSLDQLVGGRETPMPIGMAHLVFNQIADALHYAHEQGTIHRDLKPANILLDGRDHVYLTDFGFAKLMGVDLQTRSSLTLGTPVFMAPEQVENSTTTIATDVYALGAILYQMLTNHLPYEDNNVLALILRKIEDPPPPPQIFNPAISDALSNLILKAMAIEPQARFANVAAMKTAFAGIMNGTVEANELTAVSHSPSGKTTASHSRRKWLALLPLILLLACSLAYLWQMNAPLIVNGLMGETATPTITPTVLAATETSTPSSTPSPTPSPTATVTPSATASATATAAPTETATRTPRPTRKSTTTASPPPTSTATRRPIQSPTATHTGAATAVPPTPIPPTSTSAPPPTNPPPTQPAPTATPEPPTRTPPPPPTRTPPPAP